METADRSYRRRTLLIAAVGIVLATVLWNLQALDFLTYPLRLFVTFIHESGHGLAAIVSGGQVVNLTVYADGSGIATTAGGARWLILPAGYIGAALFGAVLFYLANTVRHVQWVTAATALLIALLSLLYTDFLSTAWLVGLGFALVLGALALRGSHIVNQTALNFLAVLCALNAVTDLLSLINASGVSRGPVRNDAAAFSADVMPLLPSWLIAICWAAIAFLALGVAIWYSVIRHARREVDDAVEDLRSR